MTLASGTRLGPYEILSPIGAGGMGEVYRARDARLGREVAVKTLPAEMSQSADRLGRFEQEARSASALDHPNIIAVYDIGRSGDVVYMAMQLVEGRTLREMLEAAPFPPRRVLDLGCQIAEGLASAHAAGIVHRDLKPENVMISKDGFVKILDFGLAKLAEPSPGNVSDMPTQAAPSTTPGTIMGTVGYMSPEQASGAKTDFRSDQFSLGTMLYEMSTGKKAFQRPTSAETLTAIIREEPEPITASNPKVPAPLRWAVERCLAKEPEERYASTKDLARDLENLRDHLSEATAASGSGSASPAAAARRRRGTAAAIAGAA
ncbi:MAG TPA: serine/threonine-protein kinase, partial [Thermoanaerobaculia bacterium]|nr:serine/threonine-protein kinase [Thermoanaerobaculia bacterium]